MNNRWRHAPLPQEGLARVETLLPAFVRTARADQNACPKPAYTKGASLQACAVRACRPLHDKPYLRTVAAATLACCILAIGMYGASAQEPRAVIAVGREPFAGRLASIDTSGTLRFLDSDAEALLPMPELVRWGFPVEPKQGPLVYLADGSLLAASDISSEGADLLVSHALLGDIRLRRDQILGILIHLPANIERRDALANRILRLASDAAAAADTEADLVLLANGDELTGQLGLLSSKGLTIDGELGAADLAWDRVTAVLFGLARPKTFEAQGTQEAGVLRIIVGLGEGSRLVAQRVEFEGETVRVAPWFGNGDAVLSVAARDLVFLQPLGGRARYLSDLKPESYRHIPYLSLPWDYRLDRCVTGRYLRAGGRLYLKGVGMHSASRLTWRLDSAYRRFEAAIAIDDSAGPRGSVVFRVFVDSKERYRSPVVRGGEPAKPISIDVTGGKRLSLIVDFADRGDELDHANWLDARLVGEK